MKKFFLFAFVMFVTSSAVSAQDTANSQHKWGWLVEPYLMFPNLNGKVGLGTLPTVSVDANASDIFSHLKMVGVVYAEARKGDWVINSDIIYMKLGQDATPNTLINSGNVTAKLFLWNVSGLLRITPWLELGPAIMLNSINSSVDINKNNIGGGTTDLSKGISNTWGDFLLVARIANKPGQKFIYQLRGDVGGGIGATKNAVWQVQAYAGYRFSKLFQLTGGYRVISLNYENGQGNEHFLFDADMFGPVIRFGFNF